MLAGAAKVDVTPSSPCHLAGYAARDHGHESVHDRIGLRALYVSDGNRDALIITADIIYFTENVIDRIVPELSNRFGLDRDRVIFAGSHTHSAPNPRRAENTDWIQRLIDQSVSAAALAKNELKPATLRFGRGTSGIGVNRREQVSDGKIVLGINPDGPRDRELILAQCVPETGGLIATLGCFACHGTTMSQRNYALSGDWSGVASTSIEASNEYGCFLYLNGGAANICPRIDRQESFEPVETQAAEFVSDVSRLATQLKALSGNEPIAYAARKIQLPRKQTDVENGMGRCAQVRISGLKIGSLYLVGFPGEVFSQTTMAVKAAHPDKVLMVCSYFDGGNAGYVPVREAYETGGYEVRVSPYSEDAEDVLRAELIELVEALR